MSSSKLKQCKSIKKNYQKASRLKILPCEIKGLATFGVDVQSDRSVGIVGSIFKLSAKVVIGDKKNIKWTWRTSDGQTLRGQSPSVSFATSGIKRIDITARGSGNRKATSQIIVVVDNNATGAVSVLGSRPNIVGDINGDRASSLVDAYRIARHAGHLETLSKSSQLAADLDLDGKITETDAQLMALAVTQFASIPNVLLPNTGAPGTLVTLISPQLLDLSSTVEVKVGLSKLIQPISRITKGYGTFVIPLDASVPGSMKVDPGPISIQLITNGAVSAEYTFYVSSPVTISSDPRAEVRSFLNSFEELLRTTRISVERQSQALGISENSQSIYLSSLVASERLISASVKRMRDILETPRGGEIAKLFLNYANANGLPAYRQKLAHANTHSTALYSGTFDVMQFPATRSAAQGTDVCDAILPSLCGIQETVGLLNTGSTILSGACDLLLLGAVAAAVVPADGPIVDAALLFAYATQCTTVETAVDLPFVVLGLVGDVDVDMRMTIEPDQSASITAANIKLLLEVFGADDVCALATSVGNSADKLAAKIAEQVVGRLIRRKLALQTIAKVFERLGEKTLQKFLDTLKDVAKVAVQKSAVDTAIEKFAEAYCARLGGAANLLIDPSAEILREPMPAIGTLDRNWSDGIARYTCPSSGSTDSSGKVSFVATKVLCDPADPATQTGEVQCGTRGVTITMGDNGAENDDIFEVIIDEKTVLTSNSPVRSTSTIVQLPVGDTVVTLLGRAAPDGIGTYFISFAGATVISGDALSGEDLTPGVRKVFTIRVAP